MMNMMDLRASKQASKTILVTGCGGLGCVMSRITHCPENWLKHDGYIVRFKHQSCFNHGEKISGIHFCSLVVKALSYKPEGRGFKTR
jgi:hypothetical protein